MVDEMDIMTYINGIKEDAIVVEYMNGDKRLIVNYTQPNKQAGELKSSYTIDINKHEIIRFTCY